jgi:hypothetical protein
MSADDTVRGRLVDELTRRQLSSGGWGTNASSQQSALEPSCLAALAVRSVPTTSHALQEFLVRMQNLNGSWPAFDGDDREGSWTTSLAVMAVRDCAPGVSPRLKGFHWLLKCAGKESNWLWKWKFRTTDRHVRFDPDKYGWPWFPDTLSWVVPTGFAILAVNQIPCGCADFQHASNRVDLGVEMLIDRACPGGGWNSGNGMVYGSPLFPHLDDTAVALLALSRQREHPVVQSGLLWLEKNIHGVRSPWSLSWAVLALAAHCRPVRSLVNFLSSLPDLRAVEDTGTLAAVCLALGCHDTLSALGVAR